MPITIDPNYATDGYISALDDDGNLVISGTSAVGVTAIELAIVDAGNTFTSPFPVTNVDPATGLWSITLPAISIQNTFTDGVEYTFTATVSAGTGVGDTASFASVYDISAPTITAVGVGQITITEDDDGGSFVVSVVYSEDVDVNAPPTLAFETFIGSTFTPTTAATLGLTSPVVTVDPLNLNTYLFTYVVADNDVDLTGVQVTASGGADLAGNVSASTASSVFILDTTAPTVTVDIVETGLNVASDISVVNFIFSENVVGFDASDIIISGGTVDMASFSGAGASYSVNVQADPNSTTPLDVSVAAATYTDSVGNDGGADSDSVTVDTLAPVTGVTGDITISGDGNYMAGETITFTAVFSEDVTISAGTELTLNNGQVAILIGGASDTYIFNYVVQSTDTNTTDLEVTGYQSGTITDAAGNAAIVNLTTDIDAVIDTSAPTATLALSDTLIDEGDLGGTFTVTATFDEAMDTGVAPTIALTDLFGAPVVPTDISFSGGSWNAGGTEYTFEYAVSDSDEQIDDIQVTVSGGQDIAGNAFGSVNGVQFSIDTANPIIIGMPDLADTVTEIADNDPTEGDQLVATGDIMFSDNDIETNYTFTQQAQGTGYLGIFTFGSQGGFDANNDANTRWTFTLDDSDIDYLREGEVLTQTYDVTITDGSGDLVSRSVVITITGTNDLPVIASVTSPAGVDEDAAAGAQSLSLMGSLVVDDDDIGITTGDTLTGVVANPATVDLDGTDVSADARVADLIDAANISFTNTATSDGGNQTLNFTYSATEDLDFLAAGEVLTVTYDVVVNDGTGNSAADEIVVTITGTNDAPVIAPAIIAAAMIEDTAVVADDPTTMAVETGAFLTDSGTFTFTDADDSDGHTTTVTYVTGSSVGTLAANVTTPNDNSTSTAGVVTWTFAVDNTDPEVQALATGETLVSLYEVAVSDGIDVTNQLINVTVTGTNDGPTLVVDAGTTDSDIGTVTEDVAATLTDSGTLTLADVDTTDVVEVTNITLVASDDLGGFAAANDAALLALFDTDGDAGEAGALSSTEASGTLNWTFSGASTLFDYLGGGEQLTLAYTITVSDDDGTPLSDTQVVTVTVLGANDGPTLGVVSVTDSAAETVAENSATTSGTLTLADTDTTDIVTETGITVTTNGPTGGLSTADLLALFDTDADAGEAGALDASETSGVLIWDFNSSGTPEQFDFLANGETLVLSYEITVSDDDGTPLSDTQTVEITITGRDDEAVVSTGPATSALVEDLAVVADDPTTVAIETGEFLTDTGTFDFTDVDLSDSHVSVALLSAGFPALGPLTTEITTQTDALGQGGVLTWNFAIDNNDPAVQALATGETLTTQFDIYIDSVTANGTVISFTQNTVSVTITGTNDGPTLDVVATGDSAAEGVTENAATTTGTLTLADLDVTDIVTESSITVSANGQTGTLTNAQLAALFDTDADSGEAGALDGSEASNVLNWSFNTGGTPEEFDFLANGEDLVLTYTITVTDDDGTPLSGTQDVVITVTGTNDVPVATTIVAPTTDDNAMTTLIDLLDPANVSDVDIADTLSVSNDSAAIVSSTVAVAANLPTTVAYTIDANGVLSLDPTQFDALDTGDSIDIVITYDISDGLATITNTATLTVTGVNDAPVIITPGGLSGLVTEGDGANNGVNPVQISGDVNYRDAEAGESYSTSIIDVDTFIAAGDPANVATVDPLGYVGSLASGDIATTSSLADARGAIRYTFDVTDAEIAYLSEGETVVQTYQVNVSDGDDSAIPQNVVITITGTNDVPDVGIASSIMVTENDTVTGNSGTATVTDIDLSDVVTASVTSVTQSGGTNISDVLSDAAVLAFLGVTNAAGQAIAAASGSGTVAYDFNAATDTFAFLDDGETLTLNYTLSVQDSSGVAASDTDTTTVSVTITGSNDAATVQNSAETIDEDTPDIITIADLGFDDVDGDALVSITVTSVAGGSFEDALGNVVAVGTAVTAADVAAGNLVFVPTANLSGTANFTFTANDGTIDSAPATRSYTITPVADAPTLDLDSGPVGDQLGVTEAGVEDVAIALDISAALTDPSEVLSIEISDVPIGATLSAGLATSPGIWTLAPADLAGLTITPASNDDSDFVLTVTATSTDGTVSADTVGTINVTVTAVADAPTLDVDSATAGDQTSVTLTTNEDTAVAVDIATMLVDTDGSETLTISVNGIPAGATLSNAAGALTVVAGSITLTAAELVGLTILPALNDTSPFTLSIGATATEASNNNGVVTIGTINVGVTPVNDAPVLTVPAAQSVAEGPAASIAISGLSVADVDAASGTITVLLTIPTGTGSLALSLVGLASAVTTNNGASVFLSGTLADVNATLANNVTYTVPDGDFNTVLNGGDVVLSLTVDDGGNTGLGGALSDADTVNITVTPTDDQVILSVSGPTAPFIEAVDAAPEVPVDLIDSVAITDVDAEDYDGGTFTATVQSGDTTDLLNFATGPVTVNGTDVLVSGVIVGTVAGLESDSLTVTFNANALAAEVSAVIDALTYASTDDTPATSRVVDLSLTDGDAGTLPTTQSVTVAITPSNDTPIANDDGVSVPAGTAANAIPVGAIIVSENQSLALNVLVSGDPGVVADSDPDGDAISITFVEDINDGNPIATVTGDGSTAVSTGTQTSITTDFGAQVVVDANGDVTYNITSPTAAFNALALGEIATDSFQYTIDDGNGATDTATVYVTIVGTNDPVSAVADAIVAVEGGPAMATGITGDLTGNDTDVDTNDSFSVISVNAGVNATSTTPPAGFAFQLTLSDGVLVNVRTDGTYEVVAPDSLIAGQVVTGEFEYRVSDLGGAQSFANVTVSVTGTNDVATLSGDDTGTALEDSLGTTGTILISDADAGEAEVVPQTGTAGVYGMFDIDADGSWTYSLDNADTAVQALAVGESLTESFTVVSEDGTDSIAVTVTINGANDGPTFTSLATVSALTETDAGLMTSGTLSVEDVDVSDIVTSDISVTNTTVNGVFFPGIPDAALLTLISQSSATPIAAGATAGTINWTFDSGTEAFDTVPAGVIFAIEYTFTITDSQGASASNTVTINIEGTNDLPTITAAIGNDTDVVEDGVLAGDTFATGTFNITDIDTGEAVFQAISTPDLQGDYGVFTFDSATGDYTYQLDDALSDSLTEGQMASDTLVVVSFDGTTLGTITIDITGANDAATITASTSEDTDVVEDGDASASGQLTVVDVDAGEAVFTPLSTFDLQGTYGAFSFDDATGGWSYTLDPALSDVLNDGEAAVDTLLVSSLDTTATYTISVDIVGANDAAVISGTSSGAVVEAGIDGTGDAIGTVMASGDLNSTDVDGGDADDAWVADTIGTAYGAFVINADGTWEYNLGEGLPALDALDAGDVVMEMFTVATTDGTQQVVEITLTGSNDAPTVSGAVMGSGTEDVAGVLIDLLSTASDVDADAMLSVANMSALPDWFVLSGNTLAVDTSHPAFQSLGEGAQGSSTFDYDIVDGLGGVTAAQVTVTITGVNDVPTITANLSASVIEGAGTTNFDLLAGANDVDAGTTLMITNIQGMGDGVSFDAASNNLVVDPSDAAFDSLAEGETTFQLISYDIVDGDGGVVNQVLTLTVTGTNDAPMISPQFFMDAEDNGPAGVDLLAGATDVDTDVSSLTTQNVTFLTNGTTGPVSGVALVGDTLEVDTEDAGFQPLGDGQSQVILVSYDVIDGAGGVTPNTVEITITGTDDGAVVSASTPLDIREGNLDDITVVTGTITVVDVDENDAPTFADVSVTGTYGTLVVNAAGDAFDYTLDQASVQDLDETDMVMDVLRVTDSEGNFIDVTVTVTGANDAPVIDVTTSDVSPVGDEDTAISGTIVATDVDASALLIFDVGATLPLNGAVSIDGAGNYLYTPNDDFNGTDSFTVDVSDAFITITVTVNVTVTAVNDAPVIDGAPSDISPFTDEDVSVSGTIIASDVDMGDTLTYSVMPDDAPSNGTVTFVGDTYTYTPDADYFGSDDFTVTVSDGNGGIDMVAVNVAITGVNDAPVVDLAASDLSPAGDEDADISGLIVVTDADGTDPAALTYSVGSTVPMNGSVIFDGAGGYTYTPDPDFVGMDSFDIDISDGTETVSVTIDVTLNGVNDAPVIDTTLSDVNITINEDETTSALIIASDPDAGDVLTYSIETGDGPANGTASITGNAYSYAPDENYNGTDSFTVTVTDADGETDSIVVNITVDPVNDTPVAEDDTAAGTEDAGAIMGTVATNDSDIDAGDILSYSLDTPVAGLTLNTDGSYSFDTSDAAYQDLGRAATLIIMAAYTVSDGNGGTDSAMLTISLTGTNDTPVAVADVAAANEDGPAIMGSVATNDTDADDGATLTYSLDAPVEGLTLNADGSYSYVANSPDIQDLAVGETLELTVSYTVTDENMASSSSTLTITVTGALNPVSAPSDGGTTAGGEDDEIITGSDTDDIIFGNGGGDTILGEGGDDVLYGDISQAADLTLESIEGQVFRAYQAVLDRAPDLGGYEANVQNIRFGVQTQEDLVNNLVNSVEFQQTYGALNNQQFVEQLYLNVLDRPGDAVGVAAFTAALDDGRSRADVVQEFANTPEFLILMQLPSAAFAENVPEIHTEEATVYRIYQAVFGREPDEDGFTANVDALQGNVLMVSDITERFVDSAEFQLTYGDLTTEAFVEALYTNVLPGNNDQVGREAFISRLDTDPDFDRADMVLEFVLSPEFTSRQAEAARDFVSSVYTTSDDTLDGGTGDDVMFGGRGDDTFVYDATEDGNDTILDFTSGSDVLEIEGGSDYDTLAELIALATQVGNDTVFDFGDGNTLTLENVVLTDLTDADFGFSSGSTLGAVVAPVVDVSGQSDMDLLFSHDDTDWNDLGLNLDTLI